MKCEQLKEHLVEYLYDELPDELKSEVEGALAECEECAAEFAEMRLVHELVASTPGLDVPATVHNNILREARIEAGKVTAKRESKAFSFAAFFQSPAFASVFVIFLVVTVGLVLNRQGAESPNMIDGGATAARQDTETAVAALDPPDPTEELAEELAIAEDSPDDEPGSLDGEFVAQGPEPDRIGTNAATAPLDRTPEGLVNDESELLDNLGRTATRESEVDVAADEPSPDEDRESEQTVAQIVVDGRNERETTRRMERERENEERTRSDEGRRARERDRASNRQTQEVAPTPSRDIAVASAEPAPEQQNEVPVVVAPQGAAETPEDRTVDDDAGDAIFGTATSRGNFDTDASAPRPVVTETAELGDESRNQDEWNRAYEDTQDPGVYDDDDSDEEVIAMLESASSSGSLGEMTEQQDTQDEAYWDIPAEQGFNSGSGASGQGSASPPAVQYQAEPIPEAEETSGSDYEQAAAVEPLTAIYNGAITRYNDGSYRGSIQEFDNFLQAAPTTNNYYSLALYTQGLAFIRLGNYSRAIHNLENLVNSDSNFEQITDARYQLANAYELNGQLEEALELYRELGRESGSYGDYDEAVERVQQRRRSRSRDSAGEQYYEADEASPMNSIEVE